MVAGTILIQPGRLARQARLGSHCGLVYDARRLRASWGARPIDAVIVPASRGVANLDGAARLAARLRTRLVVFCSGAAVGAHVAARLAGIVGCEALIVDVPVGYRHELLPTRTTAPQFKASSGNRHNDLSIKRNLALLMTRLHGWGKILFLDDDIGDVVDGSPIAVPVETVRRLAAQLDTHQAAGLACHKYPDNSVVCHARRLVGFRQDTFVSGAALGVNCNDQPLPFFPDQYNEDWFFFSRMAARRDLAHVGYATQAEYDPFADPLRARQEEFGDLLAEGLYELFEDQPEEMEYFRRLDGADLTYWERSIAGRRKSLDLIILMLQVALHNGTGDADQQLSALASMQAALDQLSTLTPDVCVNYLEAWKSDLCDWESATQRIRGVSETMAALEILELNEWHSINWGRAREVAKS